MSTDSTTKPLERIVESLNMMLNPRMQTIAAESLAHYAGLLVDSEADIQAALALATEDEGDDGKTPVVRVSHGLAIDLNADAIKDAVTVSLRHKHEAMTRLPDPNQPDLL